MDSSAPLTGMGCASSTPRSASPMCEHLTLRDGNTSMKQKSSVVRRLLVGAVFAIFLMGDTAPGCGPLGGGSSGGGSPTGGSCTYACPNGMCLTGGVCCPGNYPNFNGSTG